MTALTVVSPRTNPKSVVAKLLTSKGSWSVRASDSWSLIGVNKMCCQAHPAASCVHAEIF